jgi:hypothetical protein
VLVLSKHQLDCMPLSLHARRARNAQRNAQIVPDCRHGAQNFGMGFVRCRCGPNDPDRFQQDSFAWLWTLARELTLCGVCAQCQFSPTQS